MRDGAWRTRAAGQFQNAFEQRGELFFGNAVLVGFGDREALQGHRLYMTTVAAVISLPSRGGFRQVLGAFLRGVANGGFSS